MCLFNHRLIDACLCCKTPVEMPSEGRTYSKAEIERLNLQESSFRMLASHDKDSWKNRKNTQPSKILILNYDIGFQFKCVLSTRPQLSLEELTCARPIHARWVFQRKLVEFKIAFQYSFSMGWVLGKRAFLSTFCTNFGQPSWLEDICCRRAMAFLC